MLPPPLLTSSMRSLPAEKRRATSTAICAHSSVGKISLTFWSNGFSFMCSGRRSSNAGTPRIVTLVSVAASTATETWHDLTRTGLASFMKFQSRPGCASIYAISHTLPATITPEALPKVALTNRACSSGASSGRLFRCARAFAPQDVALGLLRSGSHPRSGAMLRRRRRWEAPDSASRGGAGLLSFSSASRRAASSLASCPTEKGAALRRRCSSVSPMSRSRLAPVSAFRRRCSGFSDG
mmetsp:Transcript_17189/g.39338  ORF Transcript_17189/g.39338 Transcript_17189/m.39338 type:complete len:239 (-) Transcript_17189:1048-1764(-)